MDPETARLLERLVGDAMELAQAPTAGDTFARLLAEESALRAGLERPFSARDRLSREAVHDRDALR